jgi:Helix-turn-helix domain
MSYKLVDKVLKSELPSGPKLVLAAAASFMNTSGICWPSQKTLAKRASMTTRTVSTHLRTLGDADLVSIYTSGGKRMIRLNHLHSSSDVWKQKFSVATENLVPTPIKAFMGGKKYFPTESASLNPSESNKNPADALASASETAVFEQEEFGEEPAEDEPEEDEPMSW